MGIEIIAIAHILPAVTGYFFYSASLAAILYKKSTSHTVPLKIGNITYGFGLLLGSVWAQLAWGSFIFFDSKYYISFLIFFVFLYAQLYGKEKTKWWLLFGVILIALNFVLPSVYGSLHNYFEL